MAWGEKRVTQAPMTQSTLDDYQSSGVECPACGDDFKKEQHMKSHHSQVHGESIAGVEVECDWCGDTKRVSPSRLDGRNHYCDYDCRSAYASENYTGEDSWHYKGGDFETDCHHCGDETTVARSDYQQNKRHFCSNECYRNWCSEYYGGENHPTRGQGTPVECEWCGKEKRVGPAALEEYDRHYCDNECKGKWLSANIHGKNHHLSKDGETKYGPGWNTKKKEQIRERDNRECQSCGMTEAEHLEKYGQKNPIHHITPARTFDDPEKRNHPSNLITLCSGGCHQKWDAMTPLQPV